MTIDPQEAKDGGILRDAYGRPQSVIVDKHATPASTDIPRPDGYQDVDGREQIILLTPSGDNVLDFLGEEAGVVETADTFETYKFIALSTTEVLAIPVSATPPVTPTGLNVIPRLSSVRVNWNSAAGASSYVLRRDGTPIITTSLTTYRDLNVELDDTYLYTVQAVDGYGQRSAISAAVSAYIDPALNVAPTVEVLTYPATFPTDGKTLIRVNARDANAQELELDLGVDTGTITATDDPSVWIYEP